MTQKEEMVNPAIIELIEMGNGFTGYKVSGKNREETKQNFRNHLKAAKERMKMNAHKGWKI